MTIDTKTSPATGALIILVALTPFFSRLHIPLLDGKVVQIMETVQNLCLLVGGAFTVYWIKINHLSDSSKLFWSWSVFWWVALIGRSLNWGRIYFPDGPHWLFNTIAAVLIALLVLPVLFSNTRRAIKSQWQKMKLPIMPLAVIVIAFLLADAVEHQRLIGQFILEDRRYQDFTEELFECSLIFGLCYISFNLMKHEIKRGINKDIEYVPIINCQLDHPIK